MSILFLAVVGAGSVLLGTGGTAAAASAGPGFTVAGGPSQAVTLQPGTSTQVVYTVTNTSASTEHVTATGTGLFFQGDVPQFTGEPSAGLQITPSPADLDLGPSTSADIRVTLTVAPNERPGGLYAGIVFKDVPPPVQGRVTVVAAQARPLIGHIPGPTSDIGVVAGFAALGSPSTSGPVTFQASFLDTGDIDYEVSGTVALRSGSRLLATEAVSSRLVLPRNVRSFPVRFAGPLPAGPVEADMSLVWGTRQEHSGDARAEAYVGATASGPRVTPPGDGTALAPTFIKRPSEQGSGPVRAARPVRRSDGFLVWFVRVSGLLLLLLAVAMLLGLWRRRRREERDTTAEDDVRLRPA